MYFNNFSAEGYKDRHKKSSTTTTKSSTHRDVRSMYNSIKFNLYKEENIAIKVNTKVE